MKKASLSKNFVFLAGSNFIVQFIRFLGVALVARRIGNDLFGAYNYLVLLASYGAIAVEFGLRNVAIREFSQGRGSRELVGRILRIRAGLAGFAALAVVGMARAAFPDGRFFGASALFGASLVANAFLLDFLVVVEERFFAQAAATIAQAAISLVGVYFFVHDPSDFTRIAAFFLGGQATAAGIYFAASRVWTVPSAAGRTNLRATALHGIPFLIALLFFTVQTSADLLLLGQFHQEAVLGDYSAALKIISIPQGLIAAFIVAIQPRIAREAGEPASEKLGELHYQTSRILWLVLVPTILGCWFFGDTLVAWVFGEKFPEAHRFLKPLSLSFLFSCLSLAPVQTFMTSLRTRLLLKLVFGNAIFTCCAISAVLFAGHAEFVPWTMVVAQFILMLSAWTCFPRRTFFVAEDAKNLLLPAVLMTIPLTAGTGRVSPPWMFAFSALGYVAGLAAVRIWRRPWLDAIVRG